MWACLIVTDGASSSAKHGNKGFWGYYCNQTTISQKRTLLILCPSQHFVAALSRLVQNLMRMGPKPSFIGIYKVCCPRAFWKLVLDLAAATCHEFGLDSTLQTALRSSCPSFFFALVCLGSQLVADHCNVPAIAHKTFTLYTKSIACGVAVFQPHGFLPVSFCPQPCEQTRSGSGSSINMVNKSKWTLTSHPTQPAR